jgi:hypothetical protein
VLMPENNRACMAVETVVSASAFRLPIRISRDTDDSNREVALGVLALAY